jgi:hypothetical protein
LAYRTPSISFPNKLGPALKPILSDGTGQIVDTDICAVGQIVNTGICGNGEIIDTDIAGVEQIFDTDICGVGQTVDTYLWSWIIC